MKEHLASEQTVVNLLRARTIIVDAVEHGCREAVLAEKAV
jgi:hypothetical protein